MATKDDIKEMEAVLRDVLNPFRDIDVEYEAWQLIEEEGWHKQVEANWEIAKMGDGERVRTCSNCHISQTVNVYDGKVMFNYCPYCGAKMVGRR